MEASAERGVMPTQAELIAWVRDTPPKWASETIKHWYDVFPRNGPVDVMQFVTEERWSVNAVRMDSVVGQWDHYAGCTWRDALLEPKYRAGRMANVLRMLDSNPGYYVAPVSEPKEVYFSSVDGQEWYCDGGGNHRTIVAKFALALAQARHGHPAVLPGVELRRYVVDWACHDLYLRLSKLVVERELGIDIKLERHRIDHSTKGSETYATVFFVTDWRHVGSALSNATLMTHLDADEFCAYSRWVLASHGVLSGMDRLKIALHRWFGRHPRSLVFPGFKARPHTGRRQFVEKLQAARQATPLTTRNTHGYTAE
jgi:hypothetical protein